VSGAELCNVPLGIFSYLVDEDIEEEVAAPAPLLDIPPAIIEEENSYDEDSEYAETDLDVDGAFCFFASLFEGDFQRLAISYRKSSNF
jgi:hypothetical protein